MVYRKNMGGWGQATRLVAGVLMIACGLIGLAGNPVGYVVAGAGLVTLLTGVVGYCPACGRNRNTACERNP